MEAINTCTNHLLLQAFKRIRTIRRPDSTFQWLQIIFRSAPSMCSEDVGVFASGLAYFSHKHGWWAGQANVRIKTSYCSSWNGFICRCRCLFATAAPSVLTNLWRPRLKVHVSLRILRRPSSSPPPPPPPPPPFFICCGLLISRSVGRNWVSF